MMIHVVELITLCLVMVAGYRIYSRYQLASADNTTISSSVIHPSTQTLATESNSQVNRPKNRQVRNSPDKSENIGSLSSSTKEEACSKTGQRSNNVLDDYIGDFF